MKSRKWGSIFAALGMLTNAAMAQSTWSLDQVLRAALSDHPALMGRGFEHAAAKAKQDGAEWQLYPSLNVEMATPNRSGRAGLMRIEQPLWAAGRLTADVNAAHNRSEAAAAGMEEEKLNLSLRVIAAYTEAVRQKKRQQHTNDGIAAHEKLLNMIRRRLAQEVSAVADLRLAESRMYQAMNERTAAAQALNNALVQLTQLAGRSVKDIAMQDLPDASEWTSLDALTSQALQYSPTLRRLTFETDAADEEIVSKKAACLPQLVLRVEREFGDSHEQRAMFVLLAQPGAGLSGGSNVDAAIQNREAVHMAHESAMRDAQERIALDWNEWKASQTRFENAQRFQTGSAEVFESYTRQYVIGRKTWIDVLNALREATQAQLALEDAHAQATAAHLRLSAMSGVMFDAMLGPIPDTLNQTGPTSP